MAIYVRLIRSFSLKDEINKLIDQGIISTWDYDRDGDYTHLPQQWKNEAWIHFHECDETNNQAVFGIISRRSVRLTKTIYAVYHGRFAEMLLTHFDTIIDDITISSQMINGIDK